MLQFWNNVFLNAMFPPTPLQISKLEDFLLEQLASSTGNILENRELLASLNETKHKSAAIGESLKESTVLQAKLEAEGNAYLPVAQFASR